MTLDGKKVMEILDAYEKDLFEDHIRLVLSTNEEKVTIITAAKINAVREIRDRIGLPEIKA